MPRVDASAGWRHQIPRTSLTKRLSLGAPRIVAAIAPAGYGKSAAIRQYAQTFTSYAVCDCRDLTGSVDFAGRVAGALAGGDARRERALAEQRLADADDVATWAGLMLDAWSESPQQPLFVFENAEHLAESVERIDLLARLLARTPPQRQIAICSRRALPLTLSRFAAPHELVTLREEQLAFDAGEIAEAFRDAELPRGALDQIARITRGWPIAVLLFARLAREGSLSKALEVTSGLEFVDLYDYLVEQIFAVLAPRQFERLMAIASIPGARGEEIAQVLDDPAAAAELAEVARSSPFVYRIGEDAYEAHPLARATLHERYPERCRAMLLRAAERLAPRAPLRGAQLYQAAGEPARAAHLLEGQYELFVNEVPPLFAEVVGKLDERELMRHGALWAAATAVRSSGISQRQWLYEALAVREALTDDTPLPTRIGVLTSLGNVLTNLGRHDEALEIFEVLTPPGTALPDRYRGIRLLFQASVATRVGRFADALRLWAQAEPYFADVAFTRSLGLQEVVARVARLTQPRATERALLDRSVALAHESGDATVTALALQEAVFGAWFAGEDALVEQYALELESAVRPNTAKGTEVFRASLRGDLGPLQRREAFERPRQRGYAALVACGISEGESRAAYARRALDAAETSAEPANIAIASIVCAECVPRERAAFVARARTTAGLVEAPALAAAIDAYARGADDELGLLGPLVRRLRARRLVEPVESADGLSVSIFDGVVRRGDEPVALSNRERELVVYLALHRRACTRGELLDAIWPEHEGTGSLLRVSVRRVRERLHDHDVVRQLPSGEYQLAADVRVDLDECDRTLRLAAGAPLTADLRARLEGYARVTDGTLPATLAAWEWTAPFAPRVEEIARGVLLRLGHDALEHGRDAAARAYAERVLVHDQCDEPAWELLIRAILAGDGRAAAQRAYRKYRTLLASELGAEPSPELAVLAGAKRTV
ncbi:MAG TPA: BTAD domain-containing putative transcriptional regulator [Candidatus Sulfotelmatobacter sp.]|nr:BTAD domain-containing putative transcriptional regulator [Candidatus Sulfotelmatobacter sp.]